MESKIIGVEPRTIKPQTIEEMIDSRTYLLEFQKDQLLEDLVKVPSDREHIERVLDAIFYKLFGTGTNGLSSVEQATINYVLKEFGCESE